MAISNFPDSIGEVIGWSQMVITINGIVFPGIQRIKTPDIEFGVENIYGQGVSGIGYSVGNTEPDVGAIDVLKDSYLDMLVQLTANAQEVELTNTPLTIVISSDPDQNAIVDQVIETYRNVKVTKITKPDMNQGDKSFMYTLDLRFPNEGDLDITRKV
jgi:hypothetical protein